MMSQNDTKRYYWLKLHKDFFKRHEIKIVEGMPNGKDYVLFYLKLLVESVSHEGKLRFNETIPYNEQMLSILTDTNIDVVKSAMKIFTDLNMIEILDDATIHMAEVEKLIGSETGKAQRMREYREKINATNRLQSGYNVAKSIEYRDKRLEIENRDEDLKTNIQDIKEKNHKINNKTIKSEINKIKYKEFVELTENEHQKLVAEYGENVTEELIEILNNYKGSSGKTYKSDYFALRGWVLREYTKNHNKKVQVEKQSGWQTIIDEVHQELASKGA